MKRTKQYTPNRIQRLREGIEISREEMAARIGVGRSTLQGWEKGQNISILPILANLCDELGVTIFDLLEES